MKNEKKMDIEQANKVYFQSLANTRASANMMVISWAGACLLAIFLLFQYYYLSKGYGINPFSNYFYSFIFAYFIYLVIANLLPLTGSFIYKKQIQSTILLLISYTGIFLSLILLAYIILVYSGHTLREYNQRAEIVIPFLILCVIAGFVYHYFWLKQQLKAGFSKKRTIGNYFAKSSVYSRNSIYIIFACSMIGAIFSGHFGMILGVSGSILFSYAFTQLLTEVFYLLYLKTKSREYWEDKPENNPTLWNLLLDWLKSFSLKKAKHRILLEILVFLSFTIIAYNSGYSKPGIKYPFWLVWGVRILVYTIVLDLFISIVHSIMRKFSNKRQGKK